MATCFLFIHHLNDNGCLSLGLDPQGQIIAPLAQRSFSDIKELQKNCQTIVVLPTSLFSIHRLSLPWLAEKKARAALPFALEDKLAQNVNTLHFAFDRNYYSEGQYLVIVGDKIYLSELMAKLDELGITFNLLTLDWFALNNNEAAILESNLIINDEEFQGALEPDVAGFYLNKSLITPEEHPIYSFNDSHTVLLSLPKQKVTEIKESSYIWLAQRLQKIKPINLCQGGLEHGSKQTTTKRWYQAAGLMGFLWLISFIGNYWTTLHALNKDTAELDAQIAVIYHEFFPQAQQVISPKFRITQLLKSNQSNSDSSFWHLLNTLAKTFNSSSMSFEQIRFQNQILLVTLATSNFEELESLQTRLQKANVNVRQTQASTEHDKVVSTLELSL
ncbi:general secretion pathway protein L [Legionella lansingensis]|uniref:Type II secretion system protein L n=1 Tax=Legionella lansingensis TaxID=45067 RepID=A0A0W0VTV5_9GAMM|nr:type II secretion system protein GspL [Legionella lansingensis]KTD23571.1 general secretion pathway protein L [Legionella lansingensis]SNV52294.1 general secretion pathway protein L [Legionella lansingensis]